MIITNFSSLFKFEVRGKKKLKKKGEFYLRKVASYNTILLKRDLDFKYMTCTSSQPPIIKRNKSKE